MGIFSWLIGGGASDDPPPKTETNFQEPGEKGKRVEVKSSVYSGNDEKGRHEHVFSKTYREPSGEIKHEEGYVGKDYKRTREQNDKK